MDIEEAVQLQGLLNVDLRMGISSLAYCVDLLAMKLDKGDVLSLPERVNLEANLYQLLVTDTLARRIKAVQKKLTDAGYEADIYVPEVLRGLV